MSEGLMNNCQLTNLITYVKYLTNKKYQNSPAILFQPPESWDCSYMAPLPV